MSRSTFFRKTIMGNIPDRNGSDQLYAFAYTPSEEEVRKKMDQVAQKRANKNLNQLTLEELEKTKSQSDQLVEEELNFFEKSALGSGGIAEAKRLAKKILDEEIAKKKQLVAANKPISPLPTATGPLPTKPAPTTIPGGQDKPKPALSGGKDISVSLEQLMRQHGINVNLISNMFDDVIDVVADTIKFTIEDLDVIDKELQIRELEEANPDDPRIQDLLDEMPDSPNKDFIINMSDEELDAISQSSDFTD